MRLVPVTHYAETMASGKVRILPREHGTWAMLLVPWATGSGVSGRVDAGHLILLIAALAFFLAHNHVVTWFRGVVAARVDRTATAAASLAAVFGLVGLVASLALVLRVGPAPLVLYAVAAGVLLAASLELVRRRLDHALPGQFLAALGLPLVAPVAWTIGAGAIDRVAVGLWLLNAAFFLGAVLYVRLKIEARARRVPLVAWAERLAFARGTLAADLGVLAVAGLAVVVGGFSPLVLASFATVALQTLAGVVRLDRPAVLKRVGVLATLHAAVFAALVVWLA